MSCLPIGGPAASCPPVIVLKFGGSVIRSAEDLTEIPHEVYRWVRAGWKTVVVVSAFEGETDRLLDQVRQDSDRADPAAVAALVSTGELQCAARLAISLDRAGLAVRLMDTAALGFRARGELLDAEPAGCRAPRIHDALRTSDVVVVPGYAGRNGRGDVALLGRGGSDLTALSLARWLNARCRLVKDVSGLFERDPAIAAPPPRRFQSLPWSVAAQLDGTIIQHKAVNWARQHAWAFEVAGMHQPDASRVGDLPTKFDDRSGREPEPLRVALLGAGTVGGGVLAWLRRHRDQFEIRGVCVRDRSLHPDIPHCWLAGPGELVDREFDVLVDASGDVELARWLGREGLAAGRHFVTCGKSLMSRYGAELETAARQGGSRLLYSAAAGGAAPLLESVTRVADAGGVAAIRGILNGTTNFVIDRIAAGDSPDSAVDAAREAGFAERDAADDLSGQDAANKLVLLVRAATGNWCPADEVGCQRLDERQVLRIRRIVQQGKCVRQVAAARFDGGRLRLSVRLAVVSPGSLFGRCRDEWNAAVIHDARGERHVVRGRGAGRWPTATSVVADLLDLLRARQSVGDGADSRPVSTFPRGLNEPVSVTAGLPEIP